MRATRARTAALAVVVLLLAACGGESSPGGPSGETPSSHELPTVVPTAPPTTDPAVERTPQVEAAVADLAEHLGLDPAAVSVVSHEDVTWPDGALGCPQPGMSYTQAQVPGARLVLAAEGREFSYHAGRSGDFARCESPRLGPPPADS
ncbi:hypothetical protein SAMN05216184_102289 [Georgenia satyanarayanai]|uniref:PASTA domain-containing protein n=1 Tax=Georgenia satyanarayanai TaxID=860221 RepID=A0A2Y9A616_9MICO|nr:hypothetical protein [Georgenia satyanarayanai]PYG01127.1 hypothetical protein A8987_102289 [Georgenia satyanarayanai]SSA39366.1 hypothetical protein SAMN05216184_102289 [Georgenia satyanarayanai]